MNRLLREKNRPIHRLRTGLKTVVPHTWCGVDPCRKGIQVEGVNVGQRVATCRECLKIETSESKKGSS